MELDMCGYVCFYRGKRLEVFAATQLEARNKAAAQFRARKAYEVSATLAEKDGAPVVHNPAGVP